MKKLLTVILCMLMLASCSDQLTETELRVNHAPVEQDASEYQADNILDYMYTIGNVFTEQQKKRAHQVLNYCPMVPGPKLETYSKATSRASAAFIQPRLSDCPKVNDNVNGNVYKR